MKTYQIAPRRFVLDRAEDVHGVSGTGIVALGVEFPDGTVALRWCVGAGRSTVVWSSIRHVAQIHGHDGKTKIRWIDVVQQMVEPAEDDPTTEPRSGP